MPVDHKRKLAFCHIPRTGGSSINKGLNMEVKDKHYPASYYRKTYPNYHLFAVHRPLKDRMISSLSFHKYYILNSSQEDIERSRKSYNPENWALMVKPNSYFLDVPVDTLLQFSDLENELNKMLKMLGYEEVKLKKLNSFR